MKNEGTKGTNGEGNRSKIKITVPKHQAQMLLIPNDIILHGKYQVAQGSIHGIIIKVFLGADQHKKLKYRLLLQ